MMSDEERGRYSRSARIDQTSQSQRMWEADLTDAGRKLTVEELAALELIHVCGRIERLTAIVQRSVETETFLLMHLRSIEGRMDRLETYLQRIDARYPRSGQAELGLILVAGSGHG